MKKLILTILFGMMMAISAIAQEAAKHNCQVIYAEEISDGSTMIRPAWYIDRTAKKIYFDDPTDPMYIENPEDLQSLIIKSVKKEGNTETFNLSNGAQHESTYKLVIIINPKLTSKDDLSGQTSTFTAGHTDTKDVKKIMTYDQLPDEEKQNIEFTRKFKEQQAAKKSGEATNSNSGGEDNQSVSGEKKPGDAINNAKDKVVGGAKNVFNKTKEVFKKK